MSKLPEANYTQLPNVVLDNIHDLDLAELKVMFAICRQTFGYHRKKAYLSVGTLVSKTGLSETSVKKGIADLTKRDWILRTAKAPSFEYAVKVETVGPPDPQTELELKSDRGSNSDPTPQILAPSNSDPIGGQIPTQSPSNSDPTPPQILAPLKESLKERSKESIKERGKPTRALSGRPESLAEVLEECKAQGFDESAGKAFFDYYESNGWRVGKNPMQKWRAALSGWVNRERGYGKPQHVNGPNGAVTATMSFADKQNFGKELDRVSAKLVQLSQSYSGFQTWDPKDKELRRELLERKAYLRKILGVKF